MKPQTEGGIISDIPNPVAASSPVSSGTLVSSSSSTKNKQIRIVQQQQQPKPLPRQHRRRTLRSVSGSGDRKSMGPDDSKRGGRGGGAGSILWTILMAGLLFSLIDVFYMVWLVERHPANNDSTGIRTGSTASSDQLQSSSLGKDNAQKTGRKPILDMLSRAGVYESTLGDDLELIPTWEEIVGLYGPKPIIIGLEHCQAFQDKTKGIGFIGTAGTFNSGTNLMSELLLANCRMEKRMKKLGAANRGIRWQVPWGKHTPPGDEEFRRGHKTYHDTYIDVDQILPAVTIRDPLTWLTSMCHHHYTTKWPHDNDRCPDFSRSDLMATVKYAEFKRKHESILHLWNDYYREYFEASFPRLIVRIEDLIFHPEETVKSVCECAGGSMRNDGRFKYIVTSAKKGDAAHGKMSDRTGMVDGIIKYGSDQRRISNYKFSEDLEYIRDHVDPQILKMMGYTVPDPSRAVSQ